MSISIKQVDGLTTALKVPFTVSSSEPEDPIVNQVWFNPVDRSLNIFLIEDEVGLWVRIN